MHAYKFARTTLAYCAYPLLLLLGLLKFEFARLVVSGATGTTFLPTCLDLLVVSGATRTRARKNEDSSRYPQDDLRTNLRTGHKGVPSKDTRPSFGRGAVKGNTGWFTRTNSCPRALLQTWFKNL